MLRRVGLGEVFRAPSFAYLRDTDPTIEETIIPLNSNCESDGLGRARRVHLLRLKQHAAACKKRSQPPAVVWFPDEPGEPDDPVALWLLRGIQDVCVFSVELTGLGSDNPLRPTVNAAVEAVNDLARNADVHGFNPQRIHVCGRGIGAAVALGCALQCKRAASTELQVLSVSLILPTFPFSCDDSADTSWLSCAMPIEAPIRERLPAIILCSCSSDHRFDRHQRPDQLFANLRRKASEAYHVRLCGTSKGALVYDTRGVSCFLTTVRFVMCRQVFVS